MNKRIFFWITIIIFSHLNFLFSEDNTRSLGFGLQPALRNPTAADPRLIVKRIFGSTKYRLTPGDSYDLLLRMEETETFPLFLLQDYKLEIPFLGTIDVKGMYFSELRDLLLKEIKARMPVSFVSLILSSPALFDVFVYGGVENPGIVAVTPITRMTEAIALASGLKKGASYRQINVERSDKTIKCDLSKFVREADLSQNLILTPGDKIFIPHAEILTLILGKIKYPDMYELIPGETLKYLINVAGGILPGASETKIEVVRFQEQEIPLLLTVNLSEAASFIMQNGDNVYVRPASENQEMILLEAALFGEPTTGVEPQTIPTGPIIANVPFTPELTLLRLLDTFGGPTPFADAESSFIERGENKERIYINIDELWKTRDLDKDIFLAPGDYVFIPRKKLKVAVVGEVNDPGVFDYSSGTTVGDYIQAAGGPDLETADITGIYLLDEEYNKEKVTLSTEIEPEQIVYMDKRPVLHVTQGLETITTFFSFATAVLATTATIIQLISTFTQ